MNEPSIYARAGADKDAELVLLRREVAWWTQFRSRCDVSGYVPSVGETVTGKVFRIDDGSKPKLCTEVTSLNFGQAIEALKGGQRVTRAGWNGKGMWLALQVPDGHSKMTLPYIYMRTAGAVGDLVPWLASQTDMLAEDWQLAS